MSLPRVARTVEEMRTWRQEQARQGLRVGLVPTMGALHPGHVSLMAHAVLLAQSVAVSIFVNPTQFGPGEDFERYPRNLAQDLVLLQSSGVKVVFAPDVATLYPPGAQTFVEVEQVSQGLCGARRPGHFRGVATVVTKLLAIVRPDVAVFGEKDYQQLQVIRTLNQDLFLGADIVGAPIVREADGLAMSSRNAYLSDDERQRAVSLIQGLRSAQRRAQTGETSAARLIQDVRDSLAKAQAREDYVELVDARTLEPLTRVQPGRPARLLVAAFVGKTRLIDNLSL